MANYRKSFNLRNGVQVDDDNFIVNSNGLVGIGTSVPTEFLDVRGNTKVVGLITSNTLHTGIATVGFLTATQGLCVSGVASATVFSGSASGLTGIYAIAVDGWIVNTSNSSISTTFNVGIGTTLPSGKLQVGTGITFYSTGDSVVSGIITASSFYGSGVGLTALNASNISSGTISNSRLPSNISVSGVVTASSGFVGNVTGTASVAQSLTGSPNISVTNITASNYNSSGILTSGTISGTTATINTVNSGFSTSGITTIYSQLNVAALGKIGVGTDNPNADIHIRDANNGASIQLTSDGSNESYIAIGRSVTRNGNNGELKFGNTNGSYQYSSSSSLDIINYGLGNINSYLQLGSSGVGTGNFNWFYGQTYNTPLMSLTYGGKLGIGVTNPTNTLHVVGTSTVTSHSYIGGNGSVTGNFTVGGLLTVGTLNATTLSATSFTGNLIGDVTASNTSSFNNLNVSGITSLGVVNNVTRIGIATTASSTWLLQTNSGGSSFIVNNTGGIGVGTDKFKYASGLTYTVLVDSSSGVGYFEGVGIGTTTPSSFADFSRAGANHPNLGSTFQFMIPPKVSTATRAGLSTVEGAFIYNTTSKRLEFYNGNSWLGIATV